MPPGMVMKASERETMVSLRFERFSVCSSCIPGTTERPLAERPEVVTPITLPPAETVALAISPIRPIS